MHKYHYGFLKHSGTRGMHWGQRNYQNPDGTWTELGKARRRKGGQWTGAGHGYSGYTSGKSMFYSGNKDDTYKQWYNGSKSLVNTNFARSISEHSKIPMKTSVSTIEEDIEKANPNRGYGNYTDNNCVGCSVAYIMRRYGLDAQASAIPQGTTDDAMQDWINWKPESYSPIHTMNKYGTDDGCFAIRKEITQLSEQKCGLLRVGYRPNGNSGHMMVWERLDNGNVIILNPQDKTLDPHEWLYESIKSGRIVTYDWSEGISLNHKALEGGRNNDGSKAESEYGICVERYRGG